MIMFKPILVKLLQNINSQRVCEFGGMERWSGLLEWSTGLGYWSAMPTNAQFGPTSMATNLIFKRYKAGRWQRIDELKNITWSSYT